MPKVIDVEEQSRELANDLHHMNAALGVSNICMLAMFEGWGGSGSHPDLLPVSHFEMSTITLDDCCCG